MERFAQRVEINRRPSSFNGPHRPYSSNQLGINPGFVGVERGITEIIIRRPSEIGQSCPMSIRELQRGRRRRVVSRFEARNRVFRVFVRVPRTTTMGWREEREGKDENG